MKNIYILYYLIREGLINFLLQKEEFIEVGFKRDFTVCEMAHKKCISILSRLSICFQDFLESTTVTLLVNFCNF